MALTPANLKQVKITDGFWTKWIEANRTFGLRHQHKMLESTGRLEALTLTWKGERLNYARWRELCAEGKPTPHIFWDSDVAKWIEAVAYALMSKPDVELETMMNDVVDLVVKAQEPDGYFNSFFSACDPDNRWRCLQWNHELYCAGHMMEAAVAHFEATGRRDFLDAMSRYADYIATVFGVEPGKKRGYCGHEEIELALVKLYHATGLKRHLDLCAYFINERGQQPAYFTEEAREWQEKNINAWWVPGNFNWKDTVHNTYAYCQSHKPVREQDEVVGHSVRAMYLYCGMADLALELGDEALRTACDRLWENLTTKKLYVTGGIGSVAGIEGFGPAYHLGNKDAYDETCAAIGLVFWAQRMLRISCDRKYADVMERALYNGVLSGISLNGEKFFYVNPLESWGDHHRQEWFGCACCPPNIARLLPSLATYATASDASSIAVHLFIGGQASYAVGGKNVTLTTTTNYPWDGKVVFDVAGNGATFAMKIRVPAWAVGAKATLNGKPVDATTLENGYLVIQRTWSKDDRIELDLPMEVRMEYAHPKVRADAGTAAIVRGPIVYCLEGVDNAFDLFGVSVSPTTKWTTTAEPNLLGGVVTISGPATIDDDSDWNDTLYRTTPPKTVTKTIKAVPYYAWDNRDASEMRVWVRVKA